MRTLLALACALVVAGCGDKEPAPKTPPQTPYSAGPAGKPGTIDQSTPTRLAEGIFAAVRAGDLAALKGIADPAGTDGDAKQVANVADAPPEQQAEFKKHFATGKVNGAPKIVGDNAEVPILFGPDGKQAETLKLAKRDGKWYLHSL